MYAKRHIWPFEGLETAFDVLFSPTTTSHPGAEQGAHHDRLPRLHEEPVRQGRAHLAAAPVLRAAQGEQADLGRLHRLPQRGQELSHQRAALQEGKKDRQLDG